MTYASPAASKNFPGTNGMASGSNGGFSAILLIPKGGSQEPA